MSSSSLPRTLVCVPIFVEEVDAALADARAARDSGADLVEFRIDSYLRDDGSEGDSGGSEPLASDPELSPADHLAELSRLVAQCPLPCIITCRPVLEGGQYGGPESARLDLLRALAAIDPPGHAPRFIDLELATYTRSAGLKAHLNTVFDPPEDAPASARDRAPSLILSSHDFNSRPPDLIRQLERMYSEPACRVVKVAYRARSIRDNLELLDITAAGDGSNRAPGEERPRPTKPIIALGMGPFGLMSRVLAPKFGGFLTFASLRRDSATAPGQPTLAELLSLFRFRAINPGTRVYGVVGWPVEHSLSPLIHNAGFEAVEHDGVYLPLPVPPEYEHFKASILELLDHQFLDLAGLSVTMPHKEHLVRLAREEWEGGDGRWELDVLSQRCGAANTLTIQRSGSGQPQRMLVANTDGPAAADALGECSRVLILGAGGTARAVATELLHRGNLVAIANRTVANAERLAGELASATKLPPPPVLPLGETMRDAMAWGPDAIINTTPVGMPGGSSSTTAGSPAAPAASPLNEQQLRQFSGLQSLADCVYVPLETPLMQAARHAGVPRVTSGLVMFVGQAADQFERWTAKAAPRGLFDRVAREALAVRV